MKHGREDEDLREELLAHIEIGTEENIARGMTPEEARRQAQLSIGNVTVLVERLRAARPLFWAGTLWQDVQFALRLLLRSPGFTLAAVACLAIGIGVTTGIYSNLQASVFRPLPGVGDPLKLVTVQTSLPFDTYEEVRKRNDQFSALSAYLGPVPFVVTPPGGSPERIWGHLASPDYFETLRVHPLAGRLFSPETDRPGATGVVISERFWRLRFGASFQAVGSAVRINGRPVTVIGVAAENFLGASPMAAAADIWVPTTAPANLAPELEQLHNREVGFSLIGRLQPGRSQSQVEAALEPLARRLEQIHNDPGKERKERRVILLPAGRYVPLRDEDLVKTIGFPVILVGLVLLMSCANVANMLVARGAVRRREIAIRLSIGAGRGRIVRQLLTESVLLAAMGGALGLVLARALMTWYESMTATMPAYVHVDWSFNWGALACSAVVTLLAAVLFGLAPALQATRGDVSSSLKPAGPPPLRARRWFSLRNILVAHQIVASMVLLMLTGFIVVGFGTLSTAGLGFETRNLYLLSVDPVRDGYDAARVAAYFDRLPQRLQRLPGVTAVSLAQSLPMAMTGGDSLVTAKMEVAGSTKALGTVRSDRVGGGFFETMGIPVLRGRGIAQRDTADAAAVIVVNETMARRVWPGQDPIGQVLDFDGKPHQVIGVAGDIRPPVPLGPMMPAVYQPATPAHFTTPSARGVTVIVRVRPGFDAGTELRREAEAFDANVKVFQVRRMEDIVGEVFYMVRMATRIYGGMGVFALILASVGLAGVTAYSVARRTREIGIRMALGATRASVLGLVLREASIIIAVGAVVGLGLAMAVGRVLGSMMNAFAEGTSTSLTDPALLVGAPFLLVALALVACYIPARKSTRVNPAEALRAE